MKGLLSEGVGALLLLCKMIGTRRACEDCQKQMGWGVGGWQALGNGDNYIVILVVCPTEGATSLPICDYAFFSALAEILCIEDAEMGERIDVGRQKLVPSHDSMKFHTPPSPLALHPLNGEGSAVFPFCSQFHAWLDPSPLPLAYQNHATTQVKRKKKGMMIMQMGMHSLHLQWQHPYFLLWHYKHW